MIKAFAAAAAAVPPGLAAADGPAADGAAAAGDAIFLLPASGTLLQVYTWLPAQLPLQQKLVLLGRCMVLTGQLISQVLAAPAAVQWATNEFRTSMAPSTARGKLQRLLGYCARSVNILTAELDHVQLPGAADAAVELHAQLAGLASCISSLVRDSMPQLFSDDSNGSAAADAGATATGSAGPRPGVTAAEMQDIAKQMLSLELGQQLQQVGTALVMQLPQPLWCCNPRCSSLAQLSELALVGGKGCVCSGCRTARFCSRECLTACWTNQLHRRVCKRIAATAAESAVPGKPAAAAAAAEG
jgi:hypothetical protein